MLTRRQVLTGTAAVSIAAIASARGVAAAAPGADAGFDGGFGNLQDGAAVAFHKDELGFLFFIKFEGSAAQVFYKEEAPGEIGVFLKYFAKIEPFHKVSWQLVDQFPGFLKHGGAEAGFSKVTPKLALIFLKYLKDDQQNFVYDNRTWENGLLLPGGDPCQSQVG